MVRRNNLCSSVRSVGDKNNHPWGKKWFIRGEGYYRPPLSPPEEGRTGLSVSWESLCVVCPYLECPLEVLLIVFLYNYVVNILCIKTGDGYDFYSMLKQAEIEVQSTSNRKLPNFYEKVTDFLLESYRISKWWQNHVLTEACRCCYKYLVLTCRTMWLFIQIHCLFMHLSHFRYRSRWAFQTPCRQDGNNSLFISCFCLLLLFAK